MFLMRSSEEKGDVLCVALRARLVKVTQATFCDRPNHQPPFCCFFCCCSLRFARFFSSYGCKRSHSATFVTYGHIRCSERRAMCGRRLRRRNGVEVSVRGADLVREHGGRSAASGEGQARDGGGGVGREEDQLAVIPAG